MYMTTSTSFNFNALKITNNLYWFVGYALKLKLVLDKFCLFIRRVSVAFSDVFPSHCETETRQWMHDVSIRQTYCCWNRHGIHAGSNYILYSWNRHGPTIYYIVGTGMDYIWTQSRRNVRLWFRTYFVFFVVHLIYDHAAQRRTYMFHAAPITFQIR